MNVRTPNTGIGETATNFSLKDADGKVWTLDDVKGENGTVVAFICNHCPYVKAVIDRFVEDAKAMRANGIGVVAIMSNDWAVSPGDSPDRMKAFAKEHALPFPYLIDESQEVARKYGAVCTPDVFGFDRALQLRYRGRIDSAGRDAAGPETKRELLDAMRQIARTGDGPKDQTPSIGCSIKWRQ